MAITMAHQQPRQRTRYGTALEVNEYRDRIQKRPQQTPTPLAQPAQRRTPHPGQSPQTFRLKWLDSSPLRSNPLFPQQIIEELLSIAQ